MFCDPFIPRAGHLNCNSRERVTKVALKPVLWQSGGKNPLRKLNAPTPCFKFRK